jgi:RHS repeat-associated protein
LNRLLTATETGAWSQGYGYDRYGNRWLASGYIVPGNEGLTPQFSTDFNASTNRLNASLYDTSGNQTRDQLGRGFTYDAENHQVTFNGNAGTYSYDGDGRRVKKIDSTGTTLFVYNASGQLIAEYHSDPVPPAQSGGTSYLTSDHLGSTRLVTDSGGNVKARYDYLPFGEAIPSTVGVRSSIPGYSGNDTTRQRYTGKERDAENDLDNFDTRYMSSAQGRFMSPDVPLIGQHPAHPQSWNLYAYVRNNPCSLIDPDGLDCVYATDDGKGVESIDHNSNSGECGDHGGTWVPGNVNENNAFYNDKNEMFQVASNDGENIYYSTFASGAITRENGTCVTGCGGADIQHANAAWLSSMIVGGNLDQMMFFMSHRDKPIHGILFPGGIGGVLEQMLSGGLAFWENHYAGPAGMGPPHGESDWAAMDHDYNFKTNGITIGSYFNPFIKKATAKALIQSNNNLIRNARGIQKIKFGLVFGIINAFQFYVQSFK